jgi:hypothetical protein
MHFFKSLFGRRDDTSEKTTNATEAGKDIEDVRRSQNESGEVILNLWYVSNTIAITSLRARPYVASGSDDDKLSFLRMRANHDFRGAETYPVPEHMKVNVTFVGGPKDIPETKACLQKTLDTLGGYPALFRDVLSNVPSHGHYFDPARPMVCITGLVEGADGQLSARVDEFVQL